MSKKRANVEFITPPNFIKAKVGSGGLSDEVITRAQQIIEAHTEDFMPIAKVYLDQMLEAIQTAKSRSEEDDISDLLEGFTLPAVQLKANGAMFHYHLVTRIANTLVNFIESTQRLDNEVTEIALAFHTTINIVITSKIRKNGDPKGEVLLQELESACSRYLDKYKEEIRAQNA